MDSSSYKELEFDNEDFMLDPFNDGEAMTDMSKLVSNDQSLDNNVQGGSVDGQEPFANMHIDNLQ